MSWKTCFMAFCKNISGKPAILNPLTLGKFIFCNTAMTETILSKLEASRKELLDLGMRNSLLNYKLPSGKWLHIVQEMSSAIFDILKKQGKAMSFLGRTSKDGSQEEMPFVAMDEPVSEEAYSDNRRQTNGIETA